MDFIIVFLITLNILDCHGVSLKQQLEHIGRAQMESLGRINTVPETRRYLSFHPGHKSLVLGAPSMPSHLPEAEPILPGHTLIRPALGMLKSAVKFPHKDLDEGTGVYGNMNNLGLTWGGTSGRVLYTGFRRAGDNPKIVPQKTSSLKSLIILVSNNRNGQKVLVLPKLERISKQR